MTASTISAAVSAVGLALLAAPCYAQTQAVTMTHVAPPPPAAAQDSTIRPFRANVPEAALVDLRRRIAATRWPDRETVADRSQGVQLARIKALVGLTS